MSDNPINPRYLLYGGAKKSTAEMTPEELKEAAQNALRRAKEKALPIYFSRADVVMAEYPDGHIEVVKKD